MLLYRQLIHAIFFIGFPWSNQYLQTVIPPSFLTANVSFEGKDLKQLSPGLVLPQKLPKPAFQTHFFRRQKSRRVMKIGMNVHLDLADDWRLSVLESCAK